jgi:hypothetical protein
MNSNGGGGLFCIVILVAIVGIWLFVQYQRNQAIAAARAAYEAGLNELKKHPTNADLKQRALALGRSYSNLTRNKKGVAMFDEIAVMNDINAATAGATAQQPQPGPTPTRGTVQERLTQLDQLRTQGVINEQEWQTRKAAILEDL